MYKNVHLSPDFRASQVSMGLLFTVEGEQTLIAGDASLVEVRSAEEVTFFWSGQLYRAINAGGVLDIDRVGSAEDDYPF